MGGGDKGIRRGDDFTGNSQRLQRGDKCNGAIGKQSQVFNTKILTKRSLQLLMEGAIVGQPFALPNLFQIGNELFQRGKIRLGYGDGLVGHECVKRLYKSRYWPLIVAGE